MLGNKLLIMCSLLLLVSCGSSGETTDDSGSGGGGSDQGGGGSVTTVETVTSNLILNLTTDKCAYKPGETVNFTAEGTLPSGARVRYRKLGETVADEALSSSTWTWTAPSADYQGYLAEVYQKSGDNAVTILGTIAVDVSSNWDTFPRYGFVATFSSDKTDAVIENEMAWLNRCHINGVQFQDWHYKHHWPCPIDKDGKIFDTYKDIANRTNVTSVVKKYISVQHGYGMKCMFYNLAFGALDDAASDGVKEEWELYKQTGRTDRDQHSLPSSWKSNIYLVNPANTEWQDYIAKRNEDVYNNFDFDGYQIDQLGDRGDLYDYNSNKVNLLTGYASFINAMKKARPDKELVMNAVSGYGSQQILQTGNVGFCYNEVWGDEDQFSNLYTIIKANNTYSSNSLKTVFAAYMDYSLDNTSFNIPGVLLTDAVMFALGGSHLELGDHMLCREYFPYTGVGMTQELKTQMEHYYDFMTAYETLLRGSGTEISLIPSSSDITFNAWPPVLHQVTAYSREVNGKKVVNLINFLNASSLSWRDMDGTQTAARKRSNLAMTLNISTKVSRIWVATPDEHGGAAQELKFEQKNGVVSFTLPSLRYWTMLVIE